MWKPQKRRFMPGTICSRLGECERGCGMPLTSAIIISTRIILIIIKSDSGALMVASTITNDSGSTFPWQQAANCLSSTSCPCPCPCHGHHNPPNQPWLYDLPQILCCLLSHIFRIFFLYFVMMRLKINTRKDMAGNSFWANASQNKATAKNPTDIRTHFTAREKFTFE